jgi:hypothetical protein
MVDTVGEFDFCRDVLLFLSTKGGRYSPPSRKNTLFGWYYSPLFEFANSINYRDGIFACPCCHVQLDRDKNAAKNILALGLQGCVIPEAPGLSRGE